MRQRQMGARDVQRQKRPLHCRYMPRLHSIPEEDDHGDREDHSDQHSDGADHSADNSEADTQEFDDDLSEFQGMCDLRSSLGKRR